MKIYNEFNERRSQGNAKIMDESFLPFKRFFALDTVAYSEGALPEKYKELMGLVGSLVLRCNDCVLYHIEKAMQAGASRKEIIESLNIALVIGGSIVIPHLRIAMEALDEIYGTIKEAIDEPEI